MAFSIITIGTTSQTNRPFWFTNNDRVSQLFSVPYSAAHRSPAYVGNVTPVQFVQVDSLINGGIARFGISEANHSGLQLSGNVNAGGGGTGDTRNNRSAGVNRVGSSARQYRAVVLKVSGGHIGMVRTGSGATTYVYNSSGGVTGSWVGPSYTRVHYNTVPSQVGGLVAASDPENPESAMRLTWGAPGNNGGTPVTGYRIQWSRQSNFSVIDGTIASTGSTALTRTISGLASQTTYYFRVAALNAVSAAHGPAHSGLYSAVASASTSAGTSTSAENNIIAYQNFVALRGTQSVYVVSDSTGKSVPDYVWASSGASVRVRTVAPGVIEMTINGPASPLGPRYPGPYRFEVEYEGVKYPTLVIRGRGVRSDPKTIRIYTGAGENITAQQNGARVNNPALASRDLVFNRATQATQRLSGSASEISFEVAQNAPFEIGTLTRWDDAIWRVRSVVVTNGRKRCIAQHYTTAEDVAAEWIGQVVDDMTAAWSGLRAEDIKIKPLYEAPN